MTKHRLITNTTYERSLIKGLLWMIGGSVLSYGLFISLATFSVVERISTEKKEKQLSSEIHDMELSYLQKSEQLDVTFAKTIGFIDVLSQNFAPEPSVALRDAAR